jgi:hypothetical protein
MSIDAVALLRIALLPPPETRWGRPHPVEHRGDATLINLMIRWDGAAPDELALALRELVGDPLDAHDDPRGVLFFADVWNHDGDGYDAILARIGKDGVWAAMVGADHVPLRYRTADPDSRDGITGRLIAAIGRDPALALVMTVEVAGYGHAARPEDADAAANFDQALKPVAAALGDRAAAMLRRHVAALAQRPLPPPLLLEE